MWDYEKLIQFENAAADSQPSLKIDFILNVPQAPLPLHAAMTTARQIKTLNHLRHVNVRRRYGEDCFNTQSRNFIAHPRGEARPAGSPRWESTPFCHLPSKKNLDSSPATDPAANKWRDEKWPPSRRTRRRPCLCVLCLPLVSHD